MFLNTEAGRFLIFEIEKSEENVLSEGMEKFIPAQEDIDSQ